MSVVNWWNHVRSKERCCTKLLWPRRTTTAQLSCAAKIPTSDFLFPSVVRSTVFVVGSRSLLCDTHLRRFCKLVTSVSVILQNLFSVSERERKCYTRHRKREVPSVIHMTPFIRTLAAFAPRVLEVTHTLDQDDTTSFSEHLCLPDLPIWAPFACCPLNTRSGLVNFFAIFSKTAPPRSSLCTTLPSHGDDVLQPLPQLQHCAEQD